ncbi:hypothetical protein PIB30_078852, partial [Stylosanthes scabra]|nr:hypothetical protein [Stylosanthes scabra]
MEKLIGGDSKYHNTIPLNTRNIIPSLGCLRVAPSHPRDVATAWRLHWGTFLW